MNCHLHVPPYPLAMGRIEVRGSNLKDGATRLASTLTLLLSLEKGEAPVERMRTMRLLRFCCQNER
jgi:hypothetical protein